MRKMMALACAAALLASCSDGDAVQDDEGRGAASIEASAGLDQTMDEDAPAEASSGEPLISTSGSQRGCEHVNYQRGGKAGAVRLNDDSTGIYAEVQNTGGPNNFVLQEIPQDDVADWVLAKYRNDGISGSEYAYVGAFSCETGQDGPTVLTQELLSSHAGGLSDEGPEPSQAVILVGRNYLRRLPIR